ncbi:hypothetical protein JCM39194_02790 [Desulfotomaculum varum]
MFDIICYRLKGHLHYQYEIVPAGKPIEDVIDNWQNVLDSHRVSGFATEEDARRYAREKYDSN